VTLNWSAGSPAPAAGYRIYYDQAGKLQFRAGVSAGTTAYTDSGLSRNTRYCYRVTAWNDCNDNGVFDAGVDTESAASNQACATAQ
jgi:fibronectin type 3 domain-containing protein